MEEEEREEMREETSGDFEHQRRANGTQVFRETYSEGAIQRLKHLIKVSYEEKKNRFYSILVDGETVVDRTSDVRKFDTYVKYRNPFTKVITVMMYKGYSFNCNRYEFTVNPSLNGLSGLTQKEEVQKAIAEFKREQEHEALQKSVKKKSKKLRELRAIMEEIEGENESNIDFDRVTGMIQKALGLVSQIKGNPPAALGGVETIEPDDDDISLEPVLEVEEKPKKKRKQTEEQQMFNALFGNLGKDEVIKMLAFMKNMSQHPELNAKFQEELNNKKDN